MIVSQHTHSGTSSDLTPCLSLCLLCKPVLSIGMWFWISICVLIIGLATRNRILLSRRNLPDTFGIRLHGMIMNIYAQVLTLLFLLINILLPDLNDTVIETTIIEWFIITVMQCHMVAGTIARTWFFEQKANAKRIRALESPELSRVQSVSGAGLHVATSAIAIELSGRILTQVLRDARGYQSFLTHVKSEFASEYVPGSQACACAGGIDMLIDRSAVFRYGFALPPPRPHRCACA
jgi:hypothetical protein